ncbi:MAG: hypothetical protein IAF94_12140 [Pirellulaceae bacterium]|nr:hypothetical protein [Pirellulaceae bacterium]
MALLHQELQAYKGWLEVWLSAAGVPAASNTTPGKVVAQVKAAANPAATTTTATTTTAAAEKMGLPAQFLEARTSTASSTPKPTETTPAAAAGHGGQTQPHAQPQAQSHGSGFNAGASNNVAVYFGQSDATASKPLDMLCSDPNVNIVVVAFVSEFFPAGAGGYPKVNFGAACERAQTAAMQSAGATGLLSCPDLASKIQTCQNKGKIVLLSLGGAVASSTFTSDQQAQDFAKTLWELFGGGTPADAGLRPFGSVKVDGFDIGMPSSPCLLD